MEQNGECTNNSEGYNMSQYKSTASDYEQKIEEAPLDGLRYARKNGSWVSSVDTITGDNSFAYGDRRTIINMKLNAINETAINHSIENIVNGDESLITQFKNSYDYKGSTPVFYFTLIKRQRPLTIHLKIAKTHSFGKFAFQASENGLSGWKNITGYKALEGGTTEHVFNTILDQDESYFYFRMVGHPTEDCTIAAAAQFMELTMTMGNFTSIPLQSEPVDGEAYVRKNGRWTKVYDAFAKASLVEIIYSEYIQSVNLLPSHSYFIDTSNKSVNIYLPNNPTTGDTIEVTDYRKTFGINACILKLNDGDLINGSKVMNNRDSLSNFGMIYKFVYISSSYGWSRLMTSTFS